MLATGAGVL